MWLALGIAMEDPVNAIIPASEAAADSASQAETSVAAYDSSLSRQYHLWDCNLKPEAGAETGILMTMSVLERIRKEVASKAMSNRFSRRQVSK